VGLTHSALTERIIGTFFDVHREPGAGFLESVYEAALGIALRDAGLDVATQVPIRVGFRGRIVGVFRADLIVARTVVVEVKAVGTLVPAHEAQLINYLKASGLELGLLVNFGPSVEFKRRICTNAHTG
jgi:GxxExxY protein